MYIVMDFCHNSHAVEVVVLWNRPVKLTYGSQIVIVEQKNIRIEAS